ncbi:hypothetical protein BDV96DRAFT_636843 [Lophiotrema nucula]|uniref:Uncharacterized protein n=1 Tax=Lophiotrema nucula TaxID=690887 RepID=A0A6A5YMB6_9PLEO|nr:hypothetical protein BDV96DRAFT_636843 [Lophiotrema nucula]
MFLAHRIARSSIGGQSVARLRHTTSSWKPVTRWTLQARVGAQRASFWSGGVSEPGSSGGGQHWEWPSAVINALDNGNDRILCPQCFFHPDGKDKNRDLRDAFPFHLSTAEIFDLVDRIDWGVDYVCNAGPSNDVPKVITTDTRRLAQCIRDIAEARTDNRKIPISKYHELTMRISVFAVLWHFSNFGRWIMSDKDAEDLWKLEDTAESIRRVVHANKVLRSSAGEVLPTPIVNGQLGALEGKSPNEILGYAYTVFSGVGLQLDMNKQWFSKHEQAMLIATAGRLRNLAIQHEPNLASGGMKRGNSSSKENVKELLRNAFDPEASR